jgi:hypothetical protein
MTQSPTRSERVSQRVGQVVLSIAALLMIVIGRKYIVDPTGAAASSGITLPSSLGLTNMRAGVGGFTLGLGIVTALSAWSRTMLVSGLRTLLVVLGVVFVVRAAGALVDGTVAQSAHILIPEFLIVAASLGALLSMRMTRNRASRPSP